MKFDSATPLHDLAPAIDPGIEKVTGALFHVLQRVIIEVKASNGNSGFHKLNAISLEDASPESRTSELEDELNTAIMSIATSYVAETDESTRFRARYMSVGAEGEEVRKYVCFKVLSDEEQAADAKLGFKFQPPGPTSGLEQWMPIIRWVVAMFEARERMMIAYNEGLTDKLLKSAAQAEPLLRAQGKVAKMSEHALTMAFQAAVTQGAAVGAQQVLPEAPEGDSFGSEVLKPGLEMALWQFFNRGKEPPPGFSGVPGSPPSASSAAEASPGAPSAPGATGAGASSGPEAASAEGKGATTGEVVVDPIVRTIAMWLGSMDGGQAIELMEKLSAEQNRSLQAVRSAKSDEAAAQAVLELQASLMQGGNGLELLGLLDSAQQDVLMRIQAMAKQQVERPGG